MVTAISIGARTIGPGNPCFIIAEAGVNHNGELAKAFRLIDVAAEAHVDAIKFQLFTAEGLVTRTAPRARYQAHNTRQEGSQFEMLKTLELSPEAHIELKRYAEKKGLIFLSTPFDEQCADILDGIGLPAFKVPSGEITNLPLLEHVARKMKPMIVSTGMSTLDEVTEAVGSIRRMGNSQIILLHCVSSYPADSRYANLRAMHTLELTFDVPIGYSDHTAGIEISLAAVALGACTIEKHFTLDRSLPGPDHKASLEPEELRALARGIRSVESCLGDGVKKPVLPEQDIAAVARKSLVATRTIAAGEVLRKECIVAKRPGTGIPPAFFHHVVGLTAKQEIHADDVLQWGMFL